MPPANGGGGVLQAGSALWLRQRAAKVRQQAVARSATALVATLVAGTMHILAEVAGVATDQLRVPIEVVGSCAVVAAVGAMAWGNMYLPAVKQPMRSPYFVVAACIVSIEGYRFVMYNGLVEGLNPAAVLRQCGRSVPWEPIAISANVTLPATVPPPLPYFAFYFVAFTVMCLGVVLLDAQIVAFRRFLLPLIGYLLVTQALRYVAAVFSPAGPPLACLGGFFLIDDTTWQRTSCVQAGLIAARAATAAVADRKCRYAIFVLIPMRMDASRAPQRARAARLLPGAAAAPSGVRRPRGSSRSGTQISARVEDRERAARVYNVAGTAMLLGVACFVVSEFATRFTAVYYVAIVGMPFFSIAGVVCVCIRLRRALIYQARPWANQNIVVSTVAALVVFCCDIVVPATPFGRFLTVAFTATVVSVVAQDMLDPLPPRWLRASVMVLLCIICAFNTVSTHFRSTPTLLDRAGSTFTVDDLRRTAYVSIITMAIRATIIALSDKHSDGALFAFVRKPRIAVVRDALRGRGKTTLPRHATQAHAAWGTLRRAYAPASRPKRPVSAAYGPRSPAQTPPAPPPPPVSTAKPHLPSVVRLARAKLLPLAPPSCRDDKRGHAPAPGPAGAGASPAGRRTLWSFPPPAVDRKGAAPAAAPVTPAGSGTGASGGAGWVVYENSLFRGPGSGPPRGDGGNGSNDAGRGGEQVQ